MCQRNELILGVGQIGVDRRRERVFLIAALFEVGDVLVAGGVVERVAHAVQTCLPRRHRVFDAPLGRHARPDLIALNDLLQRRDAGLEAHPAVPGWMAGRVSVITLVGTPALGSATPIRQSRVMISTSWYSLQPAVPSGRIGMTMNRCFWLESCTWMEISSGRYSPNSASTWRGQRTRRLR